MAELASPILGGINSARGMMSPRVMSGVAEQQREVERQVILSSVSNLVGGLSTRLDELVYKLMILENHFKLYQHQLHKTLS